MAEEIKTWKQWACETRFVVWVRKNPLKPIYFIVTFLISIALVILFYRLYLEILSLEWGKPTTDAIPTTDGNIITDSKTESNPVNVQNLALAFLGITSGFVALFGGYLAILKSEENKRQSDAAESQSKAAHEQNKIAIKQNELTNAQNEITNEQNEIANKQNETTNEQNRIANEQNKIANRQANTAEQGIITDRINKATEGLGKNDGKGAIVEVRLGALYALERIAQDSIRDHLQIMEILCAYVRHNSPLESGNDGRKILREDIGAAVTIIGRRGDWPEGEKRIETERKKGYCIGLGRCHLYAAQINNARLEHAAIIGANLQAVRFMDTKLNRAWICNSNITDALLDRADMQDVNTQGVYAYRGDFSKCKNLTQKQLNSMFFGIDVQIPDNLARPGHWSTKKLSENEFIEAYYEWFNNN